MFPRVMSPAQFSPKDRRVVCCQTPETLRYCSRSMPGELTAIPYASFVPSLSASPSAIVSKRRGEISCDDQPEPVHSKVRMPFERPTTMSRRPSASMSAMPMSPSYPYGRASPTVDVCQVPGGGGGGGGGGGAAHCSAP